MANDQQAQDQSQDQKAAAALGQNGQNTGQPDETDGLKDKKPEELTQEELRLMADTMPGDGPGD